MYIYDIFVCIHEKYTMQTCLNSHIGPFLRMIESEPEAEISVVNSHDI